MSRGLLQVARRDQLLRTPKGCPTKEQPQPRSRLGKSGLLFCARAYRLRRWCAQRRMPSGMRSAPGSAFLCHSAISADQLCAENTYIPLDTTSLPKMLNKCTFLALWNYEQNCDTPIAYRPMARKYASLNKNGGRRDIHSGTGVKSAREHSSQSRTDQVSRAAGAELAAPRCCRRSCHRCSSRRGAGP